MGLVIYFSNIKAIKSIKKMDVNISYVNKAGKYLTAYCDASEFQKIKKELKKHRLVRRIEESMIEMPSLDL